MLTDFYTSIIFITERLGFRFRVSRQEYPARIYQNQIRQKLTVKRVLALGAPRLALLGAVVSGRSELVA